MKLSVIIKPAIAAAACAALVLGIAKSPNIIPTDDTSSPVTPSTIAETVANTFTMQALAKGQKKELKKNMAIASLNSYSAAWGGDNESLETNYVEAFPMICEGKNIEKITYSINKGAFQIFNKTGDGFILDGVKTENGSLGHLNVGGITPKGYDIEDDATGRIGIGYDEGYYKSFSVSPDFQYGDDVCVSICDNVRVSKSTYRKLWAYSFKDATEEEKREESQNEGRNEVLSKVRITCTVTYKDGSTESKEIAVGSKLMTAKEAGDTDMEEKAEADEEKLYDYTTFTVI